jgi:hypothetical protein
MVKKIGLQKRRLRRLIKLLEWDVNNKEGVQFDLNTVAHPTNYPMISFVGKREIPINCGTTACAMGLAAISGEFNKEGLGFTVCNTSRLDIKWKGKFSSYYESAQWLFGITESQALYLFSPSSYPESKQKGAVAERFVIRRIKNVIEGKKINYEKYADR